MRPHFIISFENPWKNDTIQKIRHPLTLVCRCGLGDIRRFEKTTPLQSVKSWKCDPIQRHIPVAHYRESPHSPSGIMTAAAEKKLKMPSIAQWNKLQTTDKTKPNPRKGVVSLQCNRSRLNSSSCKWTQILNSHTTSISGKVAGKVNRLNIL